MEFATISGAALLVAVVWLLARPKRRASRRSGMPRLWDRAPGAETYSWAALSDGGPGDHGSGSGHSHHSHHGGGFDSSTNAPSDGGHFGGDGGGGDGGGGE